MEFRIADTFTASIAKLTGEEQKAVKTSAFDLQLNPANPGLQFHRIERSKDSNFWSVRVNRDIRIIVHKTESSLMLCYVDHHDDAYKWAERRKIERHPKTGAAQLVEIEETVREIEIPKYVHTEDETPKTKTQLLFVNISNDVLLSYGVPTEWIEIVKTATEDTLFEIVDHLPSEAAEALVELATGGTPKVPVQIPEDTSPFEHPDAQRRFRIMTNYEELERALEYPWDKWSVFLHPAQREIVEREYSGPARVAGSAGTGKTVVALHRAVYLVRKDSEARVLLTTFSNTLANALKNQLRRLIGNEPKLAERLEVHSIQEIGERLYKSNFGKLQIATDENVMSLLKSTAQESEEQKFSIKFLWDEWLNVVDAWQLSDWESYRDVSRLGRKKRLAETQRDLLWQIFSQVQKELSQQKLITPAGMFFGLAKHLGKAKHPPFEHVVIDEAQDVSVAQLQFLSAVGGDRPDSLFFAGDLGQRIFQQPFSWKGLGVDIRGRSKILKINYRTSHQIRSQADRLLPSDLADVDGVSEERTGTVSVFNGVPPTIKTAKDVDEELTIVSNWLSALVADGYQPQEMGIFVRSDSELPRAREVLKETKIPFIELNESMMTKSGHLTLCSMHLAKGLEFRAVVVMACDDEVIPLQSRLEVTTDESDLEDVYQTERHLLYVACTRARDRLLVTGVEPVSEFLEDLSY